VVGDPLGELIDACDAVLGLYRRLTRSGGADEVLGDVAMQAELDQLAAAVRDAKDKRTQSRGDPGE
jgi:hypothetical protein